MNTYSFSDEAIADLEVICDYIAQNNSDAAIKLFDAIRQKCKTIAQFPQMGKKYDKLSDSLRGFIVDDYIFSVNSVVKHAQACNCWVSLRSCLGKISIYFLAMQYPNKGNYIFSNFANIFFKTLSKLDYHTFFSKS